MLEISVGPGVFLAKVLLECFLEQEGILTGIMDSKLFLPWKCFSLILN
uniref:Uncharacterized protein n=1 Tax=Anguilla anguilla TaxID=7936 RepID=A0A0E9TEJ3_ANGAN